jgi:hypothetical protein
MNDQTEVPSTLKVLLDWLDALADVAGTDVELRLTRDFAGVGDGLRIMAIYTPNDGQRRIGNMQLARKVLELFRPGVDSFVLAQITDAMRPLPLNPRRLP